MRIRRIKREITGAGVLERIHSYITDYEFKHYNKPEFIEVTAEEWLALMAETQHIWQGAPIGNAFTSGMEFNTTTYGGVCERPQIPQPTVFGVPVRVIYR